MALRRLLFFRRDHAPRKRRRRRRISEFDRINRRAGMVPVQPEVSGLQSSTPHLQRGAALASVSLYDQEYPATAYVRRQIEEREINRQVKKRRWRMGTPPPILSYTEDTDLSATQYQPWLDRHLPRFEPLQESAAQRGVLSTRSRREDPNRLIAHRPLLPRHYRHFLRYSAYPRVAAALMVGTLGAILWLRVNEVQQGQGVALKGDFSARHALQRELSAASRYGVDPRHLIALQHQAHSLARQSAPQGFMVTGARASFFLRQEQSYKGLLVLVRRLEHGALRYWQQQEGRALAARTSVLRSIHARGRVAYAVSGHPARQCGTPVCLRHIVSLYAAQTAALRRLVPPVSHRRHLSSTESSGVVVVSLHEGAVAFYRGTHLLHTAYFRPGMQTSIGVFRVARVYRSSSSGRLGSVRIQLTSGLTLTASGAAKSAGTGAGGNSYAGPHGARTIRLLRPDARSLTLWTRPGMEVVVY